MGYYKIYYNKCLDFCIVLIGNCKSSHNNINLWTPEDYDLVDSGIGDCGCDIDHALLQAIINNVKDKASKQMEWVNEIRKNGY